MNVSKKENKNVNSFLSAITSILFTIVNGLLTIIVVRVILLNYGSDFNGLNTTANQIVSILLVLESGFTIASNVALFKPIADGDSLMISRIISTTRVAFLRIGLLYLTIGIIAILLYSRLINSELPYFEIVIILLISLLPTGLNLLFATKYAVLFQSSQHEYILNIIKIITCIIGNSIVIIFAKIVANRIVFRALMLLNPILAMLITIVYGRKSFSNISINMKPDFSLISGTKDLIVQKFVGLFYSTAPILIMSARIGTVAISVYGVYSSITALMKSIANALMNSPRMSLGVLIAEKDNDRIRVVFREYEDIVFICASVMTAVYYTMIIPFMKLYTAGVNDAEYIRLDVAVVLGMVFYIECLHIPSGIFLNMSGMFKVSKVIQSVAAVILIIAMGVSYIIGTMIAFAVAIMIAAISLACMEITYVHTKDVLFGEKMGCISLRDMAFFIIITIVMATVGFNINLQCSDYFQLFCMGTIAIVVSSIVNLIIIYFYNRELLSRIRYITTLLFKKQYNK